MIRAVVSHPVLTLLGVALLGLADFWLTRVGFQWHERHRRRVVEYERYEQNPLWDRAIHQTKRYDWRHLLVLAGTCAGVGYLLATDQGTLAFETVFFVSLLLLMYVQIIAGHLASLRRSHFYGTSPDDIQGKVRYSYRATLRLGMIVDQMDAVPLIVMALLLPHPVTLAAAVSPLVFATLRAFWLRLHELRSRGHRPHPLRLVWEYGMLGCHLIIIMGGAHWLWRKLS